VAVELMSVRWAPWRDGYHRELLRLVYRFLFLLVVEDRALLHQPDQETGGLSRTFCQHTRNEKEGGTCRR
jgi:hypothetical protein